MYDMTTISVSPVDWDVKRQSNKKCVPLTAEADNILGSIDVPPPTINGLWVFLFQKTGAECL